ncbi:hypothetical protein BH24ACT22_BH24ACT22_04840 [soil metagenome]
MPRPTRNFLIFAGALWGFVFALVPAMGAFDGPLNLSPFLISALLCAASSGAVGTLAAGWLANRTRNFRTKDSRLRWLLSGFVTGLFQALVIGVLAALTIWLAMTITMTGFSVATPNAIYLLVSQPSIFLQSAIVARTILVYALVVGAVTAPFSGLAINRMVDRKVALQ